MTQIPLFLNSSSAHFREARLWSERLTSYPQCERKQIVACIVKHIKMGIKSK